MERLMNPGIECTDPDQLQFCQKISDTKFWYCEPNTYHDSLLPDADTPARRLYEKYSGYPRQMLKDAHTSEEVSDFITNSTLWLTGEIDADDFTREEQEKLLDDYGYSWDSFDDEANRNQIICENYFEQNGPDFRNDN